MGVGFCVPLTSVTRTGLRRTTHRSRPLVQCNVARASGLRASHALANSLTEWGLDVNRSDSFDVHALNVSPPLIYVRNFLTHEECDAIIHTQESKAEAADESDLYLNYRVNNVRTALDTSTEAANLLQEIGEGCALSSSSRSGFRTRVHKREHALQAVLPKVLTLMGERRQIEFSEHQWIRPNAQRIVVRDVTSVRYAQGEGVVPHVDGKDATLLVYLNDVPKGGETTFPEVEVSVPPRKGDALLYHSKTGLLHYADEVKIGHKWIMQMLIDFRVRADELSHVDYASGQVQNN